VHHPQITNMPLSFAAIKHIHMGAAALSISLFIVRGGWMLWSPQRLRQPWVKVLPHVIDTALLAAALWLAWQLGAAAMRSWLAAKVVGLLVYIVLGTIALKRGRTRRTRIAAFVAAIATFGYIVMVALTKSPLGVFAQI
jgi:uncharacterized membrane protein SirB2